MGRIRGKQRGEAKPIHIGSQKEKKQNHSAPAQNQFRFEEPRSKKQSADRNVAVFGRRTGQFLFGHADENLRFPPAQQFRKASFAFRIGISPTEIPE